MTARILAGVLGGLLLAIGLVSVLLSWAGLATLVGAGLLAWARPLRLPTRLHHTRPTDHHEHDYQVQPPPPVSPQQAAACPCVTVTQTYAVKLDPHCTWHNPTP
jgi:hypothetical protein